MVCLTFGIRYPATGLFVFLEVLGSIYFRGVGLGELSCVLVIDVGRLLSLSKENTEGFSHFRYSMRAVWVVFSIPLCFTDMFIDLVTVRVPVFAGANKETAVLSHLYMDLFSVDANITLSTYTFILAVYHVLLCRIQRVFCQP